MSLSLAAQLQTPYDPKADYRTWSVKGKALPYILGNGGGISAMLGVEYGFAKNQSIGVDVFADWSESSDDNVADTAGVQHAFGNFYNGFEKALFLEMGRFISITIPCIRSSAGCPIASVSIPPG
jgi:hypothetical protein